MGIDKLESAKHLPLLSIDIYWHLWSIRPWCLKYPKIYSQRAPSWPTVITAGSRAAQALWAGRQRDGDVLGCGVATIQFSYTRDDLMYIICKIQQDSDLKTEGFGDTARASSSGCHRSELG